MESWSIKTPRGTISKSCESFDKACLWFGEVIGEGFSIGIYGKFELKDCDEEGEPVIFEAITKSATNY